MDISFTFQHGETTAEVSTRRQGGRYYPCPEKLGRIDRTVSFELDLEKLAAD
jgi:hypothetical protein